MRGAVDTSAVFLYYLLPYGRDRHRVSCGGFNRRKERRGWGMAHFTEHAIAGSCLLQGDQAGYSAGRRHKSHRLQVAGASDMGCPVVPGCAAALGHTLLLIIANDS